MKEEKRETSVDNKLELLKYTSEVQSRIKTDISSDFTLAKLDDKTKEAIVELVGDAYYVKKIINQIRIKAKKWHWNNKTKNWTKTPITPEEQDRINTIGEEAFDTFMTRLYMTAILNRNVDKNHLLKVLTQENPQQEPEEKELLIKKGTKEVLKNEEQT